MHIILSYFIPLTNQATINIKIKYIMKSGIDEEGINIYKICKIGILFKDLYLNTLLTIPQNASSLDKANGIKLTRNITGGKKAYKRRFIKGIAFINKINKGKINRICFVINEREINTIDMYPLYWTTVRRVFICDTAKNSN